MVLDVTRGKSKSAWGELFRITSVTKPGTFVTAMMLARRQ